MKEIERELGPLRERVLAHPLYEQLTSEESVRAFMEIHVFAVWDFMTLVKSLQQRLTCVSTPWVPTQDRGARRLINEIVLEEESDIDPDGNPVSHFELYLSAMRAAGADCRAIERFIAGLQSGSSLDDALSTAAVPVGVSWFIRTTADFVANDDISVAASFAYGRELLIPPMFHEVVSQLSKTKREKWALLSFYLDRHIERDGEVHGRYARELVSRLAGSDERARERALDAARRSLEARLGLWDAVVQRLSRPETSPIPTPIYPNAESRTAG